MDYNSYDDFNLSDILTRMFSENKLLPESVINDEKYRSVVKNLSDDFKNINTERNHLESELTKHKAQQKAMLANISDVIIITDKNMTIKYITQNIHKNFGLDPHDLNGKKITTKIHREDLDRFKKMFKEVSLKDNHITTDEYRIMCGDGIYLYVKLTAANLLSVSEVNGVIINFHDITRFKVSENEIQNLSYIDSLTGL
ncbi:MAG: PAS domain-containing protein, partial [Eubacteriales bacterium]